MQLQLLESQSEERVQVFNLSFISSLFIHISHMPVCGLNALCVLCYCCTQPAVSLSKLMAQHCCYVLSVAATLAGMPQEGP
jgi:hypothetical protein